MAAPPSSRDRTSTRRKGRHEISWHQQGGDVPLPSAQLRNPSTRSGLRHSHNSRAPRPHQRRNDNDLNTRPQSRALRHPQPSRLADRRRSIVGLCGSVYIFGRPLIPALTVVHTRLMRIALFLSDIPKQEQSSSVDYCYQTNCG